ncbi:MAG: T9SS type A sorting domain-containing protein [Ignavibacteria bacterium]|nr:T9SS type A sorting domain-containing protein [Ignavibacteria bacterium]
MNPGITDSTVGTWPDVLKKSLSVPSSEQYNLYKFRLYPDSMNAIGRISPAYNVAIIGVDIESLRPATDAPNGQTVRRYVKGALDFTDGLLTSVSQNSTTAVPEVYSLSQNYPNPFNPSTKINFSIPKSGIVTIKIYDILGKEVMTLVNEMKQAGNYETEFTATNLASGAYFYRMESGEFKDIKRMVLIK